MNKDENSHGDDMATIQLWSRSLNKNIASWKNAKIFLRKYKSNLDMFSILCNNDRNMFSNDYIAS